MIIPSSRTIALEENIFSKPWFLYLENIYRRIRGNTSIKLGGVLDIDTTAKSNVGSGATDLISYTLPTNSLNITGDVLEVEAWGVVATNANNKTITLEFGGQTIVTTGSIAANDGSWHIKATIIRTSSNTQEIIVDIISSNALITNSSTRTAGTQDLVSNIDIKCTATGAVSDDITHQALLIKLFLNS